MTPWKLRAVVNVPKQGFAHHERMVLWCKEHIGIGNVRFFNYDLGASKTTLFHFCNEEDATAFILRWGGTA